jgi:competence protein ComEC
VLFRSLVLDFLAVGQGDATLVRWPDGRRWLVDGGPPRSDLPRVLERLGVYRLDEVVLSHAHPDHFGGLVPVVAAMPVGGLRAGHVPVELAGVPRVGGPEPGLEVLGPPAGFAPPGENDASLVLRLCHAGRCALLPGDVEAPAEAALAGLDLHADVLKAPHHGSRTSSTPAFVAAVDPQVVVICVGAHNRYGHPDLQSLGRYRGRLVRRTDQDGSVRVTLDAAGVRVERIDPPRRWLLR